MDAKGKMQGRKRGVSNRNDEEPTVIVVTLCTNRALCGGFCKRVSAGSHRGSLASEANEAMDR